MVARVGRDPRARWTAPPIGSQAPLQAHVDGFDLHAAIAVGGDDRDALERLGRYLLRPAVAQQRLSLLHDGRVLLELKREWNDGTSHLVFEPLDLLARLATFMPKPRSNLVVYNGVFAANAKWRPRVVDYLRNDDGCGGNDDLPAESEPEPEPEPEPECTRARPNYSWSDLMRRAFDVDVLDCPECHQRMKLVAVILCPSTARSILAHLGRSTNIPKPQPARAPPDDVWN
jgi:hypothetical protein